MRLSLRKSLLIAAASCLSVSALAIAEDTPPSKVESLAEWRTIEPENLLIISVSGGDIIVELNSDFAPNHARQIRELSSEGIYDGQTFYRVIDGFVAQGGLKDDTLIEPYTPLKNENDRTIETDPAYPFVPLGNADLFAASVGHMNGFAVAQDETLGREWLLHCPGTMAMARDEDPDTGSTEFYIVLDAQRYLDRNLTIFGRVLSGMELVQAFKRGDRAVESGIIQAPQTGETILKMRTAADLPEAERPIWQVMLSSSNTFEAFKKSKRVRNEAFFYRKPPEILDICSFSAPARKLVPSSED